MTIPIRDADIQTRGVTFYKSIQILECVVDIDVTGKSEKDIIILILALEKTVENMRVKIS